MLYIKIVRIELISIQYESTFLETFHKTLAA